MLQPLQRVLLIDGSLEMNINESDRSGAEMIATF